MKKFQHDVNVSTEVILASERRMIASDRASERKAVIVNSDGAGEMKVRIESDAEGLRMNLSRVEEAGIIGRRAKRSCVVQVQIRHSDRVDERITATILLTVMILFHLLREAIEDEGSRKIRNGTGAAVNRDINALSGPVEAQLGQPAI
mmetsp:Transcript_28739/g.46535  ORF Transcript_28739/g.46535 Transcript_28739/m.46535 type:complete len:148 (+) Transcript_28739:1939-2382(+)